MISPKYLILALTDACNLDCSYCYRGKKTAENYMAQSTLEKAVQLALSSERCHIQLTGGEPTLVPHLIEQVAKMVQGERKKITVGLQTNGTRIDGNLIQILKTCHIQVGISMDGPAIVNDHVRGKTERVLKGMQYLEKENISFRITTVLSAINAEYLHKLTLTAGMFKAARGIGIDLLVNKGNAQKNEIIKAPSPDQLQSGIQNMLRALSHINTYRKYPIRFREADTVRTALSGKSRQIFCHAGEGKSLAVLPDGSVYPCTQTAGDPNFFMGSIHEPEGIIPLKMKTHRLSNDDCQSCPLDGRCPGDCHSRQYYNTTEERKLVCTLYQTIFSFIKGSHHEFI